MRVLDATFLIDYLDDVDAATEYVTSHAAERFIVPLPAYAEVLVGEGNQPGAADISGAQNALAWTEVYRRSRPSASGLDPEGEGRKPR